MVNPSLEEVRGPARAVAAARARLAAEEIGRAAGAHPQLLRLDEDVAG